MGNYTELRIGKLYWSWKNEIPTFLMFLFEPDDVFLRSGPSRRMTTQEKVTRIGLSRSVLRRPVSELSPRWNATVSHLISVLTSIAFSTANFTAHTSVLSGEEMTAQRPFLPPFGGRPAVHSLHLTDFQVRPLSGRPRGHERRRVDQVVGNDPEPDPASGAVSASIATAPQAMTSFDHTDAPFAPDAPPLAAAEPSLPLMRTPRRRFPSWSRQDHTTHSALQCGLFVLGRREPPISRSDVGGRSNISMCRSSAGVHRVMSAGRRSATTRYADSLRSGHPVRLRRLAPLLPVESSRAQHEPQGQRLGQCGRRILLQQLEEGANQETDLQESRARDRGRR